MRERERDCTGKLRKTRTKDGNQPEGQYINDGNINCTRWPRSQMNTFHAESHAEEPEKCSPGR